MAKENLTGKMKGKVIQFRRGLKHVHERHFILDLSCNGKEEASKFIGKIVEWKSGAGKIIIGKISSSHGNKGLVRAVFERGLPGQAVNSYVEIKEGGTKINKER
jgi:large subunit ribosomal protein L35Ae